MLVVHERIKTRLGRDLAYTWAVRFANRASGADKPKGADIPPEKHP
jgi:hypothetical protein